MSPVPEKAPLPDLNPEFSREANAHVEKTLAHAKANRGAFATLMLLRKELHRFLSIAGQTIISPALTTVLWFFVFGYSLGGRLGEVGGISYLNFLIPGLVMMAVIMNAFFNSGFSFFIGKIHGPIVDLLTSPLGPSQIIFAYVVAGIIRGVLVGLAIWAVAIVMGADTLYNMPVTFLYLFLTSAAFSLLGLVAAILSKEFEHINFIPSFLLTPLIFLGGVFYSIQSLPEFWANISKLNPIVYMVNGLRYGMTGVTDVSLTAAWIIVSLTVCLGLGLSYYLLRKGTFYIN